MKTYREWRAIWALYYKEYRIEKSMVDAGTADDAMLATAGIAMKLNRLNMRRCAGVCQSLK